MINHFAGISLGVCPVSFISLISLDCGGVKRSSCWGLFETSTVQWGSWEFGDVDVLWATRLAMSTGTVLHIIYIIWMHYHYIYNHVIHECSGFSNNETWGLTSKHWDSSRNNNVSFLVRQAGASFMNKLVLPSKKLGDWFGALWRVIGFNFSCSLWFRQKRSICCIFDYAHEMSCFCFDGRHITL
jgi:hypothetical protein